MLKIPAPKQKLNTTKKNRLHYKKTEWELWEDMISSINWNEYKNPCIICSLSGYIGDMICDDCLGKSQCPLCHKEELIKAKIIHPASCEENMITDEWEKKRVIENGYVCLNCHWTEGMLIYRAKWWRADFYLFGSPDEKPYIEKRGNKLFIDGYEVWGGFNIVCNNIVFMTMYDYSDMQRDIQRKH